VIADSVAYLRGRPYGACAARHGGCGGDQASLIRRRDIRLPRCCARQADPSLTLAAGAPSTFGCRSSDGLDAEGTVIGPEQAARTRAACAVRVPPAVSAEARHEPAGRARLGRHRQDRADVSDLFNGHRLYRLRVTIRHPKAA
jgi:hypothetical protein